MGSQPDDGIDPEILNLMKCKIPRLVGQYGLTPGDVDEVFHTVKNRILRAMKKHGARIANMRPYLISVVNNGIASFIEHATAQKRDRRRERPLASAPDKALVSGEPTVEQTSIEWDIDAAMKDGDDDMRRLIALFRSGHSFADMETETGFTRQKIRSIWIRIERLLKDKLGPSYGDEPSE